jgi:putative nucleotidyltransferase with HDIG domain
MFVDDEPRILKAMERMLHSMRSQWDMMFVESAQEALDILDNTTFDVIITDMRMPMMNGAELLNKVLKEHPHMIRMVLSGQHSRKMILKSVQMAHQFLSKPCDAATLKSAVERAVTLRDVLNRESLSSVVSKIDSLPSLPSIYVQVIDELQAPEPSIQKVGELVCKDLGMTTKILQLVNSAFFGVRRHVENPKHAVSYLGIDTVKALVFISGIFHQFDQEHVTGFSFEELWRHSMQTAIIAKKISESEKLGKKMIDDIFIAGLLHDIGKLVLAAYCKDKYAETLQLARDQKISYSEAEYKTLGASHGEIGAYLLGLWGMHNSVVESVAFHHCLNKMNIQHFNPLIAVHVANGLENEERDSSTGDEFIPAIDNDLLEKLGFIDRLNVWREICKNIKDRKEP